jgi:hypothetical protein
VAGTALAVAALFQPARRRVQQAVDLRFNRSKYDTVRTTERFSALLRDQVDLDTLAAQLLATGDQMMQPAASLWLRSSAADQPVGGPGEHEDLAAGSRCADPGGLRARHGWLRAFADGGSARRGAVRLPGRCREPAQVLRADDVGRAGRRGGGAGHGAGRRARAGRGSLVPGRPGGAAGRVGVGGAQRRTGRTRSTRGWCAPSGMSSGWSRSRASPTPDRPGLRGAVPAGSLRAGT